MRPIVLFAALFPELIFPSATPMKLYNLVPESEKESGELFSLSFRWEKCEICWYRYLQVAHRADNR